MRRVLALLALFSPSLFAALPIDQQTLIGWQAKSQAPLLLDVRTQAEFKQGHIPGARNLSHDLLARNLSELEGFEQRPVVVYCRSGRRAALATATLEQAGFRQVYHLSGDWQGWVKAGQNVRVSD